MGIFKGIRSYLVIAFLLLFSSLSFAQTNFPCEDIGINNSLNFITNITPPDIVPGQEFCVEFTAENFNSIVGFQFTMNFDPTSITFVSFTDNVSLLGDPILPNLSEADNGILTFLWFNFAATGLSLPDGSLVYTLCFRANTSPDPCASLSITNALAPLFPDTEVNFQLSEDEKCKDSIILINGMPSTCIEIDCTDLSITCAGICNSNSGQGGIKFTACGGAPPYAVILETPNFVLPLDTIFNDFDKIQTNSMPAGNYTVRIIDDNGMEVSQNFIIDAVEGMSYDPLIITDPICSNISNGSITIENITSGLPGELFDISFSNGITYQDVTEATFERLMNGDYTLTITDMNGCESIEDITLFTPPLELDIDITPASCFGSDDGAISVTAMGGTPINGNEYNYNNIIEESFETVTPFQDNAFNNITNKYRLRVTDANGCSIDEDIDIPVAKKIEIEIVDIIDNACKNQCEASLTLNVLTPGRYTFLVRDENNTFITLGGNDGQSLFYDQELCAGQYSVMIQDTSGCSIDTFFTVLEPMDELIVVPESIQASCNMEDGQAIMNVTGGMAPYSFVWEDAPGIDNDTLYNVMSGTYNVEITDDLGCVLDTFVEVISGEELEIEAFILDNLECDGTGQGQLSVNILSSSSNDHSFEWTDENATVLANTQILDFSSPGTYIIEVISVGGACQAEDTVVIANTPGLIVNFEITEPSCSLASNGAVDINDISGGIAPYDCIWEDSNIQSCNPTGLMEGIYNVTIVDSDGCEKDTFVQLTALETDILFDIIVRLPSCPGEEDAEIRIDNIEGGAEPYSCVWEDPTIIGCNPTDLAPGSYNFAVIDINGCVKDTFVTIIESIQNISFDLDISNPMCGGDLGSISISNIDGTYPPFDVEWSEPGLNGLMATDLSAGEITITFTDGRLCTKDTTIILINEDNDFQVTINATPPDCAVGLDNGSISFPGFDSVNGTCEWEDEDLNAQNCTLIGLAPGVYNVTLTDVNGCQKDTFVDLSVEDRLEIDLGNIMDVSCFGEMDGQAIATVVNNPSGASSFNFFWSNPDDDGVGASDDASQLSPGENTVYAFDGLCTSDTITFNIEEPTIIQLDQAATISTAEMCFGDCSGSADLVAMGGTSLTGSYTYLWEDGFIGDQRTGLCPGIYYISITDDNNCEFVDSIQIDEAIILSSEIDSSSLILISCGNDNSGSMTVLAQGGCGGYGYQWTDDVSMGPTASNLSAGIYSVTVTDACGCTTTSSFEFESSTPIIATAITPDIPECQGDKVCIGIESVSGGTGINYTYSINFGARIDIDSCVMVDPGNYTLLVFDSAGCSAELQVQVQQANEFSVDLGPDIELDLGDNEALVSAVTTGGDPNYAFVWNSEAEFMCDSGDCSSILLNPFVSTSVGVIVTDQNGCIAEDELNIRLKTERNVYLPNVFNPNNLAPDNKFMILTGNGVEEVLSFRVFDRWGNLMYETFNLQAPTSTDDGWDGRRGPGGNNKAEQGVYVYTAEVRFVDNVILNYRGELTLVR